ncbi:phosphoenolpyruvate carboxykinase (ATP) [Ammoniphilus oxalaticus]|uniref:Phosphoenolpyruvate carboxykinase (ATP) n=1 Tax=Ammoniphilus oxalaticus TaxID=66863 RepID=A0A419SEQ1_9BACL|nr:phosphoenolpyruvate carboxykinase (ATP) [Ammoniphilus oxalaticus]RKD21737.1 phosphoenolpyruvate carboxykinase (ATP) [Ammoniphilus oxalaticus]
MEGKPSLQLRQILQSERVYFNLSTPQLIEEVIQRGEGMLTVSGALSVSTGKYTGRSPGDRYIVKEGSDRDHIAWGPSSAPVPINQSIEEIKFERLYQELLQYLGGKQLYVFEGAAGADAVHRIPIRVINEYAWQNLFAQQLFIHPSQEEPFEPNRAFTIVCAPGFEADPAQHGVNSEAFIIIHLSKRLIIIGGSSYAGEMKKSIFSVLNYLLPKQNVLSMHCSANVGKKGDVALFFGLSGTGKTTLSTDSERRLLGDDEHGWSERGVFNIEGGCYAKCIHLSAEQEPQIWNAIQFGSVLENVIIDKGTRVPDYNDGQLTENTRVAYPLSFIPGSIRSGVADHPRVIIFLTADAFGVLPPLAKLTKEQAVYHFLSGYTCKLAGTERGVTEPEVTFSACFGEPFLPLDPLVYARLFVEKIEKHATQVYLVNTGWTGGSYGTGSRIPLTYTRTLIKAAINGTIQQDAYVVDPIFGLSVPQAVAGVPSELLVTSNAWKDLNAYERAAKRLAQRFVQNFMRFKNVDRKIIEAGPTI